jgi:glycosyltransferase involved in cell wall biosynthesis
MRNRQTTSLGLGQAFPGIKAELNPRAYLFVLTSSCQMYSGTGCAIFDWIRYSKDTFRFSILMDVQNQLSVDLTAKFCHEFDVPLHLSMPLRMPGCPDSGVSNTALHLKQHRYDFIECVSWANSATNMGVLNAKPPATRLVFTPHSQPMWTVGSPTQYFLTSRIFRKMIRSADAVFIDSPSELDLPEFSKTNSGNIHFVPLGIDITRFDDAGIHAPHRIVCICDCRESRKRVDLLLTAFSKAHEKNPRLRLTLAGKGSEEVPVPEYSAPAITRLGYISGDCLLSLYQSSSLFVLLSDYEAFGLPIAEALCCGTPVLLNEHPVLKDLFASLPGVNWTRNTDLLYTSEQIVRLTSALPDSQAISTAARAAFCFKRTYEKKREVLLNLLPIASNPCGNID